MAENQTNKPRPNAAIIRLLNCRFGTLPNLLLRQLQSLSPAQLNSLTDRMPTFHTVADLQVWLINS